MRKLLTALLIVIAAIVLGGVTGALRPETAVAAYLGIVALGSTALILTSRPSFAPVGSVAGRKDRAVRHGVVVRAAAGARA